MEEADDIVRKHGRKATLVPLDLTELEQIDHLGAAIHQKFGRLDVLVANAATLGVLSPVGHIDPSVWDDAVRLNLTANFRIIRSLDPLLRLSKAGRAIFVTSGAARGKAFWGAYAATKAALNSLVKCYAEEMENTSVRVNLLSPGPTRTVMRAAAFPGENPESIKAPESITELFVDLAEAACGRHGELVDVSN